MKILSYNPGHDGAFAYVEDGRLVFSIEAEKSSKYRHSSLSIPDAFDVLAELQTVPDVLCRGGWWPGDSPRGQEAVADYRGSHHDQVVVSKKRLLGRTVDFFSSSHERSHLLCAFGMSNLPKGTPCYALLWEGVIGAFYEIDAELNVTKVGDVMSEPGHRYAMLYALADPTFDKSAAEFSRLSDAGKLMALASFSKRSQPSDEEERITSFLLQDCQHLKPSQCEALKEFRHYNVGLDDPEFRNFAGIFSDRLFDRFHRFATANLKQGMPLLIAGDAGSIATGTRSGENQDSFATCSSLRSRTIQVQRSVRPSTRSSISLAIPRSRGMFIPGCIFWRTKLSMQLTSTSGNRTLRPSPTCWPVT